ncbi:MAG TPA: polysaccharide biosynthesis tyrosine autokinase [Novosphingobium sp.]
MSESERMNLPDHYRSNGLAPRSLGVPGPSLARADDRLDFKTLFSVFRRRLFMFGLIVGIFVFLALNITFLQSKLYQATATVVLNNQQGDLVPETPQAQQMAPPRSEEVDTEIKIIKSQQLAATVIHKLALDRDASFVESVGGDDDVPTGAADHEIWEQSLITGMLRQLDASRMDTAYAIQISYTDPDAARSARIANAFATNYAAHEVDVKRADNQKTLALLKVRIEELRKQAQSDFQAVQDFRVRNSLLSAQATAQSEQEAAAYGQQLAAARAAAAADRGRANAAAGEASAAVVASPLLQSLRTQRATISVKIAELSGRYLDTHPDLVNARGQLADIDAQIAAETARVRAGVTAGLNASASATSHQAGSLQGNLSSARGTLAANNRALVGLDDLNRKAQASQTLYESYLNRYKEVLAQSGSEQPEARLLSMAEPPTKPVSPILVLNLALGLLVGALLGAGAAIAVESTYSGLTTRNDVERRLGVRCLGGIPLLSSIGLDDSVPADSLLAAPGSAYAEAVHGLLGAIRQGPGSRHQVIAVTSALPGEGKTSLSASLARGAAMAGETVILIDCDPFRRRQGAIFATDNTRPGLREILRDGAKLGDVMVKDPNSPAMILPITTPFADGERLLERGNFQRMIAMLREHFSLIVLDTAPILPIAEVREIVTIADSVVVCALWRKTSDSAVRAALQLLPIQSIPDLGAVLTKIDMKKQARYGAGDPGFYYAKYNEYYAKPFSA